MKEMVKVDSSAGSFDACLSTPDTEGKYPGLILIHEVWGLKDHIKDVANRFAAQGYAVLAPDLLSQTGIPAKVDQSILKEIRDPTTRDEAQKKLREATAPAQSPEFGEETVVKLQECLMYLKKQEYCTGKVGVLGFCFGGTYAFALTIAGVDLACAVAFYGQAPEPFERIEKINCPVLAFYGEEDERLMAQLPHLKGAMQKYGKSFEHHTYPNTGHAFFNDTNPVTYVKESAQDAWEKSLVFLAKFLA
jgi:carboxymethylenebutenolidase